MDKSTEHERVSETSAPTILRFTTKARISAALGISETALRVLFAWTDHSPGYTRVRLSPSSTKRMHSVDDVIDWLRRIASSRLKPSVEHMLVTNGYKIQIEDVLE
jgi:hypothetical protein